MPYLTQQPISDKKYVRKYFFVIGYTYFAFVSRRERMSVKEVISHLNGKLTHLRKNSVLRPFLRH